MYFFHADWRLVVVVIMIKAKKGWWGTAVRRMWFIAKSEEEMEEAKLVSIKEEEADNTLNTRANNFQKAIFSPDSSHDHIGKPKVPNQISLPIAHFSSRASEVEGLANANLVGINTGDKWQL